MTVDLGEWGQQVPSLDGPNPSAEARVELMINGSGSRRRRGPTRCPTFSGGGGGSDPRVKDPTYVGFSAAIRTTKRRISRRTLRRPGGRAYVHFRAISRRCQRSSVSGVAIVGTSGRAARLTRFRTGQPAAIVVRQA